MSSGVGSTEPPRSGGGGSAGAGAEAEHPNATLVRRFFTSADASRFSKKADASADLLGLEPELERVLENLEARL